MQFASSYDENLCLCINDLGYPAAGNSDCNLIIMTGPSARHALMKSEISEVVNKVSDDDSVVQVIILTLMITAN
jgi:uncharacterized protein YhbP (UPF0306 family)